MCHYGDMNADLADLVDNPRETPDVEVKGWLDLDDSVTRANLARHIAALANYGGGYLVFGISDDLTRDQNRPQSLEKFNRDVFSSIVRKYLTPTLQCDVAIVTASDGVEFPVVRVPSHGAVPIR
jgi:predicted HTH transcriptional regulator